MRWNPHRRKACVPCTRAKRRCDKKLPACQRCVDKEAVCNYPLSPPYARRRVVIPVGVTIRNEGEESIVPDHLPQRSSVDPAIITSDLADEDASDEIGIEDYSDLNIESDGGDSLRFPVLANSSWFLQNDTWIIRHPQAPNRPLRLHINILKRFMTKVRKWIYQWTQDSHSPFMHRQLFFDTGLPQCLQDAYAASTVYLARNKKNEEIVMKLLEDKPNRLLEQQQQQAVLPDADQFTLSVLNMSITEQLARVQALFIYQFISLFDGDIKLRAQAEKHMPILNEWTQQLWEAANLGGSLQTAVGDSNIFSETWGATSHSGGENAILKIWRDWLLAESVRRTWMVVNYTTCVYLTIRDGQGECAGSVSFTGRQGLWEAESAEKWFRLLTTCDPLFMPADETDWLSDKYPAQSIDTFGQSIISLMWDQNKFDLWAARSPNVH